MGYTKVNSTHNRENLKTTRSELRKNQTEAEEILWDALRGQRLYNLKFRRQHSIGNFILDFYCPEHKLGIELDGNQHLTPDGIAADAERDLWLSEYGIRILRFRNGDVLSSLPEVLRAIAQGCGFGR